MGLSDNCNKGLKQGLAALEAKVESQTVSIYQLAAGTPGVRNREWHDTAPVVPISASTTAAGRAFRLGHDFSLPTTTNTVITSLSLNDTNNTAGELDVQVLDTVITVPAGGIWVRYTGGSEGYWAIEVGLCCGPLELRDELGYSDRLDATAEVGPVFLPEGQHNFRAWNIDSGGSNSSHAVSYSTDGTNFAAALPAGTTLTLEKRPVDCVQHPVCDPIPVGWSKCPPAQCAAGPVDPAPEVPVVVPAASSLIPIADNEVDTAIRTGQIGTSTDYARADHNHPIRRQANPGDPVITIVGTGTLAASLITDRWSDEESYSWAFRAQVEATAANGWVYLVIPAIGGFQQPQIHIVGTYRQVGNPNADDGAQGAMPDAPYMGQEAHHWSSTRRVFVGQNNSKVAAARYYVEFILKYIRV